ncbi:MAG: hypothetical protein RBT11_04170 [Desulfobacterales bacterium]|jgi:hypothetical protein|nr:hypothetical protein [Desulfobacterales bacterium]
MGDIGKEFFLSRSFTGPAPYMGTHGIPVPSRLHVLEHKTFRKGQGPEFRDFLLGKIKTGERKPRALPRQVANKVARWVNTYRKRQEGRGTAYILQIMGQGAGTLRWSLERSVSLREARWNAVKKNPQIRELRDAGKHVALKSEMDSLRIRHWYRNLHYRIFITAFDSEEAMNDWNRCYSGRDLWLQQQARRSLPPHEKESFWFDALGWQKIPNEFIARLKDDAKALVFPSAFKQMRQAIARAPGGWLLLVPAAGYDLAAQDDRHGPQNHVWTKYRSFLRIEFFEGSKE